ncbi:MAG: cysteine desulfurase NifS [Bacillota bacterium]|nr:cysteine desulfurase NifS [Bacillota bacterium]MDD3297642.1 cysteine desulfurase NifS [Bacillota bacterium]MDD4707493.1 cysteine desulfurase NifS [Bacillota bacterium]
MTKRRVYVDNSATTPVHPQVLEEMLPFFNENFGNPSSVHSFGRQAKKAMDKARERVAVALGAKTEEIFFTGSGTEADNWAVKGVALANKDKGNHIITTKIEHHALLHTCEYLEKHGFEVTYLDVDEYGLISLKQLEEAIKDSTILISIMFANNEIGTIQPIGEAARIAKEKEIYFHTDSVQAMGNVKIDVKELGVDLLSISGHKIMGPKGIGVLYIRKGVRLDNLIHGGAQERRRRPGTENVAAVVGMGKAAQLATENLEQHIRDMTSLRDKLINGIYERIPHVKLNGHPTERLANNVNFSFEFIEGEALLLSLDMVGIAASSGSACTSGSLDPSHVLMAIGLSHEIAHGSLRLSLGEINTDEDVEYILEQLPPIVERLRSLSPLFKQCEGGKVSV